MYCTVLSGARLFLTGLQWADVLQAVFCAEEWVSRDAGVSSGRTRCLVSRSPKHTHARMHTTGWWWPVLKPPLRDMCLINLPALNEYMHTDLRDLLRNKAQICLSVCLSIHPSIYLATDLSVCLSIHPSYFFLIYNFYFFPSCQSKLIRYSVNTGQIIKPAGLV